MDILSGAHRPGGEGAVWHFVPADRHEKPRHQRASIELLDGGREVNEVWFENVRVPVERDLERLKRAAAQERNDGRTLDDDPLFAARIARIEIELTALEITNLRVLCAERSSRAPGPEASILKIKGTEIQQAISELLMRVAGAYALPMHSGPPYAAAGMAAYLNQRKLSIFTEEHHREDGGTLRDHAVEFEFSGQSTNSVATLRRPDRLSAPGNGAIW